MSAPQGLWQRLIHYGDISGKLLTLIGLPAAVVSGVIYMTEIRHLVSEPRVTVSVISTSARCTYDQRSRRKDGETDDQWTDRVCGENHLSFILALRLENLDSIARDITQTRLSVRFDPETQAPKDQVMLNQTRIAREEIRNDDREVTLVAFETLQLAPGQELSRTLDLRPFETENQMDFRWFQTQVRANPSRLAGAPVELRLEGRINGGAWRTLAICRPDYNADRLQRAAQNKPILRALTAGCVSG